MTLFFGVALAFSLLITLWLLFLLWQGKEILRKERMKNEHLRNMLHLLQNQGREIQSSLRSLQELRHDLRHYLQMLEGQSRSWEADVGKNLQNFQEILEETSLQTSESCLVALLVEHYRDEAEQLGAKTDIKLDLEDQWDDMTLDLYLVLGNLLENALEALSREGGGWLRVRSTVAAGWISLVVGNSSTKPLRLKNGRYQSSKAEGRYGIGLETVNKIAQQYGGEAEFTADGGTFKASVFLPRVTVPVSERETQPTGK